MTGKIFIRVVGALAFVAVAATGWDAEAGWRRHHRQSSCCCETVYDPCCAPACEPVCVSACAPACVTRVVEPSCCYRTEWISTVVQERVIVPAAGCCDGRVVSTEQSPTVAHDDASHPLDGQTDRGGVVRNVSTSSSRITQPATGR